jgi:hypothetical protein
MIPSAILIIYPQLNQNLYLTVCTDMLGKSPARKADTAGLKGVPHTISLISEFNSNPESDIFDLLEFGFLVAADERDISEILEVASGMPFALTNTVLRGVQGIIVTGSLRQWILAVTKGCRKDQTLAVRSCFDKIYMLFSQEGLANIFPHVKHDLPDHTFYLTYDKRQL